MKIFRQYWENILLKVKKLRDADARINRDREIALLLIIIVLAISMRIAVAFFLGDSVPVGKDENSYSYLAARLAGGYGFSFSEPWYPFASANTPTSHWSFLLTGFIAVIYAIFGVHPLAVRLIGAVLGGFLLTWMTYRLARRVWPERIELPLLTAGMAAFYAYFILYAAQLMTETFYITVLLWSLERAIAFEQSLQEGKRPRFSLILSLGLSLGIATLLRQAILPWIVVLFVWFFWKGIKLGQLRNTALSLFGVGFILALMILPFTIRNYLIYDDFLLLNSNAGYAMYSAQHPMHGTSFQAFEAAKLPKDIKPVPQNEAEWDRALMKRGIEFILEDPGRYALLSLSRVKDYFMFWPSSESTVANNVGRLVSFGLFLPVMIYGLWISRKEWQRFELLYIFMVFYIVLHLLTWAMTRYRLPVDAVLLLFAALGLAELAKRYSIHKSAGDVMA